jgi:hypothetical protein
MCSGQNSFCESRCGNGPQRGRALPAAGGIVISLARMNRILEVDFANRQVVSAEPMHRQVDEGGSHRSGQKVTAKLFQVQSRCQKHPTSASLKLARGEMPTAATCVNSLESEACLKSKGARGADPRCYISSPSLITSTPEKFFSTQLRTCSSR